MGKKKEESYRRLGWRVLEPRIPSVIRLPPKVDYVIPFSCVFHGKMVSDVDYYVAGSYIFFFKMEPIELRVDFSTAHRRLTDENSDGLRTID